MKLELFPCSGGMAEGFRRAGIVFDMAFDKDIDACNSYEANHGHRPIQMDARDLLRMAKAGWRPGPVQLFVADPPCTPWSRAGKRLGVADERDMLGVTADLIGILRPQAYLIGNVPGLDDSTQWHHVQDALAPLRMAGYCIADYASLDAADYGVPQHRVRPFWFGHLAGQCIRWPPPTHGPPRTDAFPGLELKPWVTCRDALGRLSLEELGRPCRLRYRGARATTDVQRKRAGKKARASRIDEPGETIRARADAPLSLTVHEDHNLSRPDSPSKTVTRNTHGDGTVLVNNRHPPAHPAHPARTLGAKDRGQSTVLEISEWPWTRAATTVHSDPRLAPPGHHGGSFLSEPGAVLLSEMAATILQGLPEDWVFSGATKGARWSQLGQAMPPALAHAVAMSVVEQMRATQKTEEA